MVCEKNLKLFLTQSEKSMFSLPRQSFGSMPSFARAFSFSFRSCLDSTHLQPA